MTPNLSLVGRIAFVTGSSRGLGSAIAQGLAAAGASVILHGRDHARLAAAATVLPGCIDRIAFDISDPIAIVDAFRTIFSRHGRLDILVNNAGVIPRSPLLDTTDDEWDSVIQLNLSAYFRCAREAARIMMPQGSGRIMMISSILGILGRATVNGYAAAKAGVHGMTRSLALELAPHGITVNAIAPGYMPTDATEALHTNAHFRDFVIGRTPMRRWGRPEELAGPAVFLGSDAASFITGHVLVADGGLTVAL